MPSPGEPGRRKLTVALLAVSLVAAFTLAATRDNPFRGPSSPYDHPGFTEVSVATEDVVEGQATIVVEGLRGRGYWCVQARSNDRAVQIACRMPGTSTGVDLMADTTGDVLYADIDLSPHTPVNQSTKQLARLLDNSFLRLWPRDRAVVEQLVQDSQPQPFFPMGDQAPPDAEDQFSTYEQNTANASWSLWTFYTGQPLALRIRTPELRDRSWPMGGDHYATPTSVATAALRAMGYTCATACSRATGLQRVSFDEHRDQIVAAQLTLRSSVNGNRKADLSGQWVRNGLPFLTPEVRTAIGQRIEKSRTSGRNWQGVIAGTPLEIRAVPGGLKPNGRAAATLEANIGVPLLHVE